MALKNEWNVSWVEIEQFGVENDRFSFLDTLPLFMQKEIKFTFGNFSFHKNCLTIYFKNKYRASHILRLSVFCWIWFIIVACEEHWDIGYSPHFISYFPHSMQSATPDKDYLLLLHHWGWEPCCPPLTNESELSGHGHLPHCCPVSIYLSCLYPYLKILRYVGKPHLQKVFIIFLLVLMHLAFKNKKI